MKLKQGNIIRQKLLFRMKSVDEENFIIKGVFSTGGEDRDGEIIDQNGWMLDDFMQNPVVLFAHDHYQPAVGKVIELAKDGSGNLAGAIQFAAKEYDFAMTLFKLYAAGFMRAFSVGFMNEKYEIDQANDTVILRENLLYEISCVNVPANAMALAFSKGIDTAPIQRVMDESKMKGVVPFAPHTTAPEKTAWDANAVQADMWQEGENQANYAKVHAWFDDTQADDDGDGYPDVKSSYKLPHHDQKYRVVWNGVAAAMGALLGARGGVNIPDNDRQGVYNHLAKHYAQFDKTVPEFKSYTDEEIKLIEVYGHEKYATIETEAAVETIAKSNIETIRPAIKALTDALNASGADNQVDKVEHPVKTGGTKKIPVTIINKAVRELLAIKKSQ